MRILITGSLVFLLWAFLASWYYVCYIKPDCGKTAETAIAVENLSSEPLPPEVVEIPKPETLILYFDFDKSVVLPSAQADEQVILFKEWIEKNPDAGLDISGHTDSKGSDAYNQKLGVSRAESTRIYLTGKSISPEKITSISKGESEPAADNTSEEGRAKNRRAEITLK